MWPFFSCSLHLSVCLTLSISLSLSLSLSISLCVSLSSFSSFLSHYTLLQILSSLFLLCGICSRMLYICLSLFSYKYIISLYLSVFLRPPFLTFLSINNFISLSLNLFYPSPLYFSLHLVYSSSLWICLPLSLHTPFLTFSLSLASL